MAQTQAWLLDLDGQQHVAVGLRHMEEFISLDEAEIMHIPLAAPYTRGMLRWRDHVVPLIDPAVVLATDAPAPAGVLVLTYQSVPGEALRHGAILLRQHPRMLIVSSDMARAIPDSQVWEMLANACLDVDGEAVPVLEVARFFSTALKALTAHRTYDAAAA